MKYTSHGGRRTAAGMVAEVTGDARLIKHAGGWKSKAPETYLNKTQSTALSIASCFHTGSNTNETSQKSALDTLSTDKEDNEDNSDEPFHKTNNPSILESNHWMSRPYHKIRARNYVSNILSRKWPIHRRWNGSKSEAVKSYALKSQVVKNEAMKSQLMGSEVVNVGIRGPETNRSDKWTDEELLVALEGLDECPVDISSKRI